ncbi:MAG: tetraacyldisaccharide 4'-kinase [Calditrichaeota bacterium]|nr:MAG: tetraacyldisaccharide 4'-kinase [Calditrichota bacterium]
MPFFENKIWRIAFWPLSFVMLVISYIRNKLYDYHVFRSYKIDAHVISVGNISVGGTGKTPVILALAESLKSKNTSVAILSRGYGRQSSGILIVSHGEGPLCDVHQAGDEPFFLATQLPDIPVVVAENRVAGGKLLCEKYNPTIVLLDDGFQHRRLQRDLDIVLIDLNRLNRNKSLLPAGPYREGIFSLKRAQNILYLNQNHDTKILLKKLRKKTKGRFFRADITSRQLWHPETGALVDISFLTHKKIMVICGIGQPARLRVTLDFHEADITAFLDFKDHHYYTDHEMTALINKFNNSGAELLITTAKDWVKLKDNSKFRQLPVYIPEHKASFAPDFIEGILEHCSLRKSPDNG